jgi:hypothetical protein
MKRLAPCQLVPRRSRRRVRAAARPPMFGGPSVLKAACRPWPRCWPQARDRTGLRALAPQGWRACPCPRPMAFGPGEVCCHWPRWGPWRVRLGCPGRPCRRHAPQAVSAACGTQSMSAAARNRAESRNRGSANHRAAACDRRWRLKPAARPCQPLRWSWGCGLGRGPHPGGSAGGRGRRSLRHWRLQRAREDHGVPEAPA